MLIWPHFPKLLFVIKAAEYMTVDIVRKMTPDSLIYYYYASDNRLNSSNGVFQFGGGGGGGTQPSLYVEVQRTCECCHVYISLNVWEH